MSVYEKGQECVYEIERRERKREMRERKRESERERDESVEWGREREATQKKANEAD